MNSARYTEKFANFALDTSGADLPREIYTRAAHALIDTLGVGIGGKEEPGSALLAAAVTAAGGAPQSTLWGHDASTHVADAAFVNAAQSHALDYDDSSLTLRGHPSSTLIPTVLAVGEAVSASGADVLAAYAVGLEISAKLSPTIGPGHYFRGWHTSATVGIFGATAAAARLLGLRSLDLQHAWGIAASQVGGLTRNFGTMTKAIHIGNAARRGVIAAQLARSQFTADPYIFDEAGGFIDTYSNEDAQSLEHQYGQLGNPWELLDPGLYVKRWPCCYASHRPIAGMLAILKQHSIMADEIQKIDIGFLPGAQQPLIYSRPRNELEAKFSVEYPVAASIVDRHIGLDSFFTDQVLRPSAQAIVEKVHRFLIPDNDIYNGLTGYNEIKVKTTRQEISERINITPGAPDTPMTEEDRRDKFIDCATRSIALEKAERLYEKAKKCESLANIKELWL